MIDYGWRRYITTDFRKESGMTPRGRDNVEEIVNSQPPKTEEKSSLGTVTLEQLVQMVADLAEEVAHGTAGHIRTAAQNKSLAVLKALRPEAAPATPGESGELCLKPREKDNDDSEVCLKPKSHVAEGTGHAYGIRPKQPTEQVQAA